MTENESKQISEKIVDVVKSLQTEEKPWVNIASISVLLNDNGVDYKQYGFLKLRSFLADFNDILELKEECEGKTPVVYVKIKEEGKEENDQGKMIDKPKYDTKKSPLMALGFTPELDKVITYLYNLLDNEHSDIETFKENLNENIDNSYNKGDILYFSYDDSSNPIKQESYSEEKTVTFAVYSGFEDSNGKKLYAQYFKSLQGWKGVYFNAEYQIWNHLNVYRIGKITFKNYDQANNFIIGLHNELLPGEIWKYSEPAKTGFRKKTEYEILESYLRTVFAALLQEVNCPNSLNYGKIKFSKDNKYALFNTGLLSKFATDIILIGEVFPKNRTSNDRFYISNPTILKRGKTELQEKGFNASDANVDMVSFFDRVSQIVYDATAKVDTDDIEKLHHCIEDGIMRNRFPQKCKEQYENGELEDLTDTLIKAIRRSERIARRNYKYVVPQYRVTTTENKIQFLMPIYMSSNYDELPDFALVLSESMIDGQKFYKPETVLELSWAYNNARVICKPDNMWLNPEKIKDVESMDDFDILE